MAARGDSEETRDGETYIEKYTRGVLEVENILSLEKLRQVIRAGFSLLTLQRILGLSWRRPRPTRFLSSQAVTVKEALAAKGRHLRRSVSTPNVERIMLTSTGVEGRTSV